MSKQPTTTVPTLEACRLMWNEVDFPPHTGVYPRVVEFVAALAAVYANGRVVHRSFHLPSHSVLDWYSSRNRYHDMRFFERFWLRPSVQSTIPQQLAPLNFYSPSVFEWSSPFMLAGSLAWVLAAGGGHTSDIVVVHWTPSASRMQLSHAAWSDYFLGVAWDYTWVLVHPQQRLIHVILATDTD